MKSNFVPRRSGAVGTIFGSAIVVLASTGCQPTVNAVEDQSRFNEAQAVNDKRIVSDGAFNKRLRVTAVNEGRANNGLRIVETTVLNTTDKTRRFRYRYTWFDGQGLQVQTPAPTWIDQAVAARNEVRVRSVAAVPGAEDFRLELMEVRTRR
ncbi:MAG: YcfL family protein [Planctomycetota bacterium]